MLNTGKLALIILGGLILAYCLFIFNGLAMRANNAETALASYKHAQLELVLKQQNEHSIKLINAQNAVNAEKEKTLKLLQDLQIDRVQTAQKIKAQYDNKISNIKRNMANRTGGVLSPASDTSPATETASDTSKFASSESDCDATITGLQSQYSTLEDACAITTQDYNQLRAWGDVVCSIATCE